MMKDTIGRALSLGLGLAVAGKEQIEKTIDELVRKGEMSRAESGSLSEELVRKGEEARERMEAFVKKRVRETIEEAGCATREDVAALEGRIAALEARLESRS
ncbi:phasin family protein [Paenibacillaceae bacterium WGS1546]|uniref:phasin family protein n=1 Tax=Cohnella sp. WGS1546 TaxID=3366810 RepID=UPI00372D4421